MTGKPRAAEPATPATPATPAKPTTGAPVPTTPTSPAPDPVDRWTAEDPNRRTRVRLRGAALGRVEVVAEDPEGAILAGLDRPTVVALVDAARRWLLDDAIALDAAQAAGAVADTTLQAKR